MFDLTFSEQQRGLREQTIDFAREQLQLQLVDRDHMGSFLRPNWNACAEHGILGLFVPEEYGGSGYDIFTTVCVMEALGYGCPDNGLTLALNGQMWAVQEPILQFGSEEQKQKYLPGMCRGELLGAHAMTEKHSGSDAFSLQTSARKVDGGFVLNGRKTYIGLGPVANVILTFATVEPERGRWGVTAFIVEAPSKGIELGSAQSKMGLRTAPMGDIIFNDCFVPDDSLLGNPGAGASIFSNSMEYERSFIFCSHVGSMARQLEQTIKFASERKQFGQVITKFQTVANRIVDMKVKLETARMFLYRTAQLIDQNQSPAMEAAMTKLVVSELFLENSLDAIRVHGGRGYVTDSEVERDLRDAVGGIIYSGTSDIQRRVIAGLLGL